MVNLTHDICEFPLIPGNSTLFEHVLERGTGLPLTYEQLPFSAPFIIMFSSGTTGAPKGIIHSQGVKEVCASTSWLY